jgi:hypothetical protein
MDSADRLGVIVGWILLFFIEFAIFGGYYCFKFDSY